MYPSSAPPRPPKPPHSQHPPNSTRASRRLVQDLFLTQKNVADDTYFWSLIEGGTNDDDDDDGDHIGKEERIDWKSGVGGGVNFKDYEKIEVVRDGPATEEVGPIKDFKDLEEHVPSYLFDNLTNVDKLSYSIPTPVQKHCIPLALSTSHPHDLMACAQTGSGKTASFLVPLITAISSSTPLPPPLTGLTPVRPRGIVVAPTRELVSQIWGEGRKLCFGGGVKVGCVYGGSPAREQLKMMSLGIDILIATPGRLSDFLNRSIISLAHVDFLVLDEADRMLDMGFEPQINNIVVQGGMKRDRRMLMFSATWKDQVKKMATKYMKEYIFVGVGRVGSPTENVRQDIVLCSSSDQWVKLTAMLPLIIKDERTIVFTQTKQTASWLRHQLFVYGFRTTDIHGDRTQDQRERSLKMFKEGRVEVLVATDVAARGLDVPEVKHVIQFDLPIGRDDFDSYVHRIGRAGRAGNEGRATAMYVAGSETKEGQNGALWPDLCRVMSESKHGAPPWFLELDEQVPVAQDRGFWSGRGRERGRGGRGRGRGRGGGGRGGGRSYGRGRGRGRGSPGISPYGGGYTTQIYMETHAPVSQHPVSGLISSMSAVDLQPHQYHPQPYPSVYTSSAIPPSSQMTYYTQPQQYYDPAAARGYYIQQGYGSIPHQQHHQQQHRGGGNAGGRGGRGTGGSNGM
ncbi:hypothetical protein TrST_g7741 [Triparma strigata]|uniref:RNA helicase n=1 Tax=Triparma strigata TaxID=1606541 RepID=A0A9W7DXT5_9STRA|nr:hypothetical protein TrST_g7741 [Triparma strigata]